MQILMQTRNKSDTLNEWLEKYVYIYSIIISQRELCGNNGDILFGVFARRFAIE